MTTTILYTIVSLSLLGVVAAVVLYFVARRFRVYEDPRIDEVEAELPGANCGGCGYAGCRNLAEVIVKSENFDGLYCPVGGNEVMARIAAILGREAVSKEARVAVLRCNGTCNNRPRTSKYDGARSCTIASSLYSGETGCLFGCHGFGDCVVSCTFDALHMDSTTGLPVVDEGKCTACGACVKACPRALFELRKRWKGDKKVYVACRNEDKGGVAKKNCLVACIGCSKCFKACPYEAIVMSSNLAFIDSDKCRLCRKCVTECPTGSIIETGFPVRKVKGDGPDQNPLTIKKEEESA
jgi:Na+-translocating ferredoxin:NAD+ oxidoreductase subunit B